MTYSQDGLDWTFALEYGALVPLDQAYAGDLAVVESDEFDYAYDGVQQMLDGFLDESPWRELFDS